MNRKTSDNPEHWHEFPDDGGRNRRNLIVWNSKCLVIANEVKIFPPFSFKKSNKKHNAHEVN